MMFSKNSTSFVRLFFSIFIFVETSCSLLLDVDSLPEIEKSFTDASAEFNKGTFQGTTLDSESFLALASGQDEGGYVSRILDAGSAVYWDSLSWDPAAPYSKSLPDNGGQETGYLSETVDMTKNVLLLHFDGGGVIGDGTEFVDTSGKKNHPVLVGSSTFVPGVIHQAFANTKATHAVIPLNKTDDFNFGTDNFTWSLWVNTDECMLNGKPGNTVYLGSQDGLGTGVTHLWLGCKYAEQNPSPESDCPSGDQGIRVSGIFQDAHNVDPGVHFCGKTNIDDGHWHHIALVKTGHSPSLITVYLDGQIEASCPGNFSKPFTFATGNQFIVGGFIYGDYNSNARFDEIAVWKRDLTFDEIKSIYSRGALWAGFKVRICKNKDCSDNPPFTGPNNDPNSWFVTGTDLTQSKVKVDLTGLPKSQYFQYLVRFISDVKSRELPKTPKVRQVKVSYSD